MQNEEELIRSVAGELGIALQGSWKEQLKMLEEEINRLLIHDFDRLVAILYRVDVSEQKLKHLLQENPDADAACIIAALLIERQQQKIESRKLFSKPQDDTDENERW